MTVAEAPRLRAVSPDATPEEVAAIVAAVVAVDRRRRAAATHGEADLDALDHWRAAARLANRRVGMTRGPWRLSGRLARRSRL